MFEIKKIEFILPDKTTVNINQLEQVIREFANSIKDDPFDIQRINDLSCFVEYYRRMKMFIIDDDTLRCAEGTITLSDGKCGEVYSINLGNFNENSRIGRIRKRRKYPEDVFPVIAENQEWEVDYSELDDYRGDDFEYECGYTVYTYYEIGKYNMSTGTLTLYSEDIVVDH